MSFVNKLTSFTGNRQDAEDAIQDTEVYKLKHPGKMQTETIFKIKAFSVAKRNYGKVKETLLEFLPDVAVESGLDAIEAAEHCAYIRSRLSPRKQKLFDILLASGGRVDDAASQSGIKVANFKTLLYDIRHNRLKEA